jgi:hypothetical protein
MLANSISRLVQIASLTFWRIVAEEVGEGSEPQEPQIIAFML